MFSPTAEYALRAAVCLAMRPGESLTSQQIAAATQVPQAFLAKVLQALGRAGIVGSQRGIGGGYTLARDAGGLSLLEVVSVITPLRRIHACPLGLAAHGARLCALHRRLDEAVAHVEEVLGGTTVAELAEDRATLGKACPFPMLGGPVAKV